MIKVKKIAVCLLAGILLVGCAQKTSFKEIPNRKVDLPAESSDLRFEKLDIQALGLIYGYCVDSLFLLKTREFENSYRVFGVEMGQDYGTILSGGEGPLEYLNVSTQGQYVSTPDSIMLWTTDNIKRKARLLNLTRTLEEKSTVIDQEYSFKKSLYNSYAINDTSFVGYTFDGLTWSFARWNPQSGQVAPLFDLLDDFRDISFLSAGSGLKYDKSRIVLAPFFFNQVFFFSPDGEERFSVSLGNPVSFEELKNKQYHERVLYFSNVAVTPEQVWILYDGCDATVSPEDRPNSRIIVMDWEGNPLYLFDTGKRLNSMFSDSSKDTIYAIDEEENLYRLHIDA